MVRVEGIETTSDAEALIGARLVAPRESIALAANEYFDDDLVGCRVLDGEREVGVVRSVQHYPAQDMLDLGFAMIPLVRAFVRQVDVAAKVVRVELPPGLVDGEAELA